MAKSVAYGKEIKVYPLSQADNPPATVFTDAADVLFDSTIRYDESFFDRDRAMIDQLKTLGIEKGKPFTPDADTKEALEAAALEAKAWLAAMYDAGLPTFFEGGHSSVPALPELVTAAPEGFPDPDQYPVDARGLTYTYAFIGIKHLGTGQFYLISIKDNRGTALRREQDLSPDRPGQCSRRAILVGDGL